jgi:UDP-N-acetylmuramoyl-tripeptide--D-alanyl-D-alanine ligase
VRVVLVVVASAALALGAAAQLLRWLRVLQREHYDPRSMARFARRWAFLPVGRARGERRAVRPTVTASVLLAVALVVALAADLDLVAVGVSVLYGLFCPVGLSLRGRTGALVWTRRATSVAVVASVLEVALAGALAATPRPYLGAILALWLVPGALAVATALLAPLERRRAESFVARARARLATVHPRVVAVTGSFGKTSTKNHLADLLGPDGGVVATPRSFNNRAGLSRAINEGLGEGTRVFIAEMGTYGPGEIAELCSWCPPEIAVVTAIGPVHLERMGSLEAIERAKFEITERAATVVVNGDDERLARWVAPLAAAGKRVLVVGSERRDVDVRLASEGDEWVLEVSGEVVGRGARVAGVQATNVACAVAAALALGVDAATLGARLALVRAVENRSRVATAPSGVVVIDDTFNANPSSAAAAIALLGSISTGRRAVVTPGLIELGPEAHEANRDLAARVAAIGAELLVVGRTNARALVEGFGAGARRVERRDEAIAWVRRELGSGDAVLYLNDLPDHYP